MNFPIGASITVDELSDSPYGAIARLREREPVSWLPALNAWWVTRRDLALTAMTDADTFTVDDERFTTARILGTSMLNLDGPEHERHRSAFVASFRPKFVREMLEARITTSAARLWAETTDGPGEIRTGIAGPLAVETILDLMGLDGVAPDEVLGWYSAFGEAITALTVGNELPEEGDETLKRLRSTVEVAMAAGGSGAITDMVSDGILSDGEIPAAVAVVLFGAIETSEAMTTNAFWHLLSDPPSWERLRADRELIPAAINESLRLEPAATWVDRYTTRTVNLGGTTIPAGELVSISLLGVNRDPEVFDDPDTFNLDRPNHAQHVTFAKGPHACIGLHVARAETHAAIITALDWEQETGTQITLSSESDRPCGLIFRRPERVLVELTRSSY